MVAATFYSVYDFSKARLELSRKSNRKTKIYYCPLQIRCSKYLFSLVFYVPNGKLKWPQIQNLLKIFKVVVLNSYFLGLFFICFHQTVLLIHFDFIKQE